MRLIRQKQQLNAARHAGSPQAETMAIESDVLEATFRDLLTKLDDSQLASNLEQRQIGEQLETARSRSRGRTAIQPRPSDLRGRGCGGGTGRRPFAVGRHPVDSLERGDAADNGRFPLRPEATTGTRGARLSGPIRNAALRNIAILERCGRAPSSARRSARIRPMTFPCRPRPAAAAVPTTAFGELHHDVDVTAGVGLSAQDRAEQGETAHA